MAKKQVSFNAAAGFFSDVPSPSDVSEPVQDLDTKNTQKYIQPEQIATDAPTPKPKKEKRIAITFNIDESLDDKLARFVFERKMAKEKISKTQVITDALVQYLNNNNL